MRVSKVELVDIERTEHSIIHGEGCCPYTFFSLDASERMKYNAFRKIRNDFEMTIEKIKDEGREIDSNERKLDEAVQEMFVELVRPYLEQSGLKVFRSLTGYGEDKKMFIDTPYYVLFGNNEPFDAALRVAYWFSTKNETLLCTSKLDYRTNGPVAKSPERHVVYDLLKKVLGEREQNGINFPIVSFSGDFVYFASTDFAMPLIGLVRDILQKVGPEAIEELNVLYREYMNQRSYGEISDTSVQQRVFKEAYERKSGIELVRVGFMDQKLIRVK